MDDEPISSDDNEDNSSCSSADSLDGVDSGGTSNCYLSPGERYYRETRRIFSEAIDNAPITTIELPEMLRENLAMEPTSTGARLQSDLVLDGILISSRSLTILSPCEIKLFQTPRIEYVNQFYGSKLKGLAFVHDKRVYSLHFCNIGPWKVSVIYATNNILPRTYFKEDKFSKCVFKLIREAMSATGSKSVEDGLKNTCELENSKLANEILFSNQWIIPADCFEDFSKILREKLVNHFSKYCKQLKLFFKEEKIDIHALNHNKQRYPEDQTLSLNKWEQFGEQPFATLEKPEDRYEDLILFTFERMGLETEIPKDVIPTIDFIDMKQHVQEMQNTEKFLFSYAKHLNMDEDVIKNNAAHVVFHIAQDFHMEREVKPNQDNNLLLFWNFLNVKELVKCEFQVYHPFALPGVANLRSRKLFPHCVNFYARLGHEVHRNNYKWFRKTRLTEVLLGLLGAMAFPQKRKTYQLSTYDNIKKQTPIFLLTKLAEFVCGSNCPSTARFEKYEQVEISEGLVCEFRIAMKRFLEFTTVEKVLFDPKYFVAIEPVALRLWFDNTIIPAANVLKHGIELLYPENSEHEESEKMLEMENLTIQPHTKEPEKLLDIANDLLVSELIVSYMITGEVAHGFNSTYVNNLGLKLLPSLSLGDKFALTHVEIINDMISVNLPRNLLDAKMAQFLTKTLHGETCHKIFEKFKKRLQWHYGKHKRHSKKGLQVVEEKMTEYLYDFFFLQFALVDDDFKKTENPTNKITSLKALKEKTLAFIKDIDLKSEESSSFTFSNKTSIFFSTVTTDEFWQTQKSEGFGLRSRIPVKALNCLLNAADCDARSHTFSALPSILIQQKLLNNMIKETTPLLFITELNNERVTVNTVLPAMLKERYADNLKLLLALFSPDNLSFMLTTQNLKEGLGNNVYLRWSENYFTDSTEHISNQLICRLWHRSFRFLKAKYGHEVFKSLFEIRTLCCAIKSKHESGTRDGLINIRNLVTEIGPSLFRNFLLHIMEINDL